MASKNLNEAVIMQAMVESNHLLTKTIELIERVLELTAPVKPIMVEISEEERAVMEAKGWGAPEAPSWRETAWDISQPVPVNSEGLGDIGRATREMPQFTPVNAEELRARDQFGGIFATPDTSNSEAWAEALETANIIFMESEGQAGDNDWALDPMRRAVIAISSLAFDRFREQVEAELRRALAATISNLQINVDEHDSSLEVGIIIRDSIARQIKG